MIGQSPQGNFTQRQYESPEHQLSPNTILSRSGYGQYHQNIAEPSGFDSQLKKQGSLKGLSPVPVAGAA
jgi:hypothetical protein